MKNRLVIIELVMLVGVMALPLGLDFFWQLLFTKILILSLVALSFDVAWGYGGVLSFCHALFFGLAGYACGLLARDAGITSVLVMIPVSIVVGTLAALVIGIFVFFGRRVPSLVFIAVATLSASFILERIARGWAYIGGQNGIPSLPRLTLGPYPIKEGLVFYYFVAAVLVAVYLLVRALTRSQLGLVMVAAREDEARVNFLGYKTQYLKAFVFCLSGAIAGLAGSLYVFHESFVGPSLLGPALSTQIVLYSLFGGVRSLVGPIIGVTVVNVAGFYFAQQLESEWPLILGFLMLASVTLRPGGIISFIVSDRELAGSFGRRGSQTSVPKDAQASAGATK